MPATEIVTFKKALKLSEDYSRRHLLLGNGFSIACRSQIFTYGSLFNAAKLDEMPRIKKIFDGLNTRDFEKVIRWLSDNAKVLPIYDSSQKALAKQMGEDAAALKERLVKTIANNHPAKPGEIAEDEFEACRAFLDNFLNFRKGESCVFTLNYDILLYWTLMHEELGGAFSFQHDDGFRKEDGNYDADYVVWDGEDAAHRQNVHYLHGALHLFDAGSELQKYTWINTGIPLVQQTREAMERNSFPLFVSEGDSKRKLERIKHHAYLHKSLRTFSSIGGSLFVMGHSLDDNDDHILGKIPKGKVEHLFVSIYGDPTSADNKRIISKANAMKLKRKGKKGLDVTFYDAASAKVWG